VFYELALRTECLFVSFREEFADRSKALFVTPGRASSVRLRMAVRAFALIAGRDACAPGMPALPACLRSQRSFYVLLLGLEPGRNAVVCSVTLPIESDSQCSGMWSGKSGELLLTGMPPSVIARLLFLSFSESSLIGDEIKSRRNLSGIMFHISMKSTMSTTEVRTACPKTCHDFPTRCSAAFKGAFLKTCSAYLARKWSRPESILVKKSSPDPDKAWETAARLVPQEAQNRSSIKLSLPQVGQNIRRTAFQANDARDC